MKIKTIEKLEEKLNVDLAWRRKELIDIKTLIEDDKNSIDKNMLIRSGIALLCAHWEGFIRYAANMYVVYIGDSKIQTKDLKENFLALALKNNIMETGKTEKNSVHSKLMHSIEEMKTICRCGRKAILNGRMINGKFTFEGEQVAIDLVDNVEYQSLCGQCYFKYKYGKDSDK